MGTALAFPIPVGWYAPSVPARAPSRPNEKSRSGAGPSDAALVVAARAGEAWAQEALYRRHAPRLNAVAFRLLGRDDEVDDVVQDAFVAALGGLARLDEPDAFGAWAVGILARQIFKKIRRRRLLARLGLGRARAGEGAIDVDAIVAPTASPERAAELRAIYGALDAMSADLRVPLVLHRVEGYGLEEVASLVGVSLATVKRRIVEADALLRREGGPR